MIGQESSVPSVDHIQQPMKEVLTRGKVKQLICLSIFCFIFGLITILSARIDEYVYLPQNDTFSCTKSALTVTDSEHDHSFVHQESNSKLSETWTDIGLDFDPTSCGYFYEREEVWDQTGDFSDREFFWFSRVEDVRPQMWNIYIEALATPKPAIDVFQAEDFTVKFDIAMAVRGKLADSEKWHMLFYQMSGDAVEE